MSESCVTYFNFFTLLQFVFILLESLGAHFFFSSILTSAFGGIYWSPASIGRVKYWLALLEINNFVSSSSKARYFILPYVSICQRA